jgi:hypothetical protein
MGIDKSDKEKIEALIEAGKEHRFTSDNQPPAELKSEGNKKHWEYRKMRQRFIEELAGIKMPNGNVENFWERVAQKMHVVLFSDKSKLKDPQKIYIMLKLLKELPKDDKMTIDFNNPPKIIVEIMKTGVKKDEPTTD